MLMLQSALHRRSRCSKNRDRLRLCVLSSHSQERLVLVVLVAHVAVGVARNVLWRKIYRAVEHGVHVHRAYRFERDLPRSRPRSSNVHCWRQDPVKKSAAASGVGGRSGERWRATVGQVVATAMGGEEVRAFEARLMERACAEGEQAEAPSTRTRRGHRPSRV